MWAVGGGRSEPATASMMCLRESPLSFGPFRVGQYTFVQISTDSRRTPASARPTTSSARVPAYTSAVSKVVIPSSSAVATHARAASSSTCEPWVIQFPYAISLIFRPDRPRRRCSMRSTLCAHRGAAALIAEPHAPRLTASHAQQPFGIAVRDPFPVCRADGRPVEERPARRVVAERVVDGEHDPAGAEDHQRAEQRRGGEEAAPGGVEVLLEGLARAPLWVRCRPAGRPV